MYGTLADAVAIAHVIYVGYVVLGQVAIIGAAPFRAAWARNPWFRFTHLGAIGYVALEVAMGWRCPLTIWEEKLRVMAGGTVFDEGDSFLARMAHNTLVHEGYPPIFFDTLNAGFAVLVIQALIMYPPRWFRFGKRDQSPSSATTSDFITSRNNTVA